MKLIEVVKRMLIDVHNHIGPSGDGCSSTVEALIRVLDQGRVDRSIIFPIDDQAGTTYPQLNDAVLAAQQKYPKRFIGFCRVNPKEGQAAIQELQRCLDAGLQGLKLHPMSDRFTPDIARPLLVAANDYALPVVVHTGHQKRCHPNLWIPALKAFSRIRVVLTHGGKDGYRDLAKGLKDAHNIKCETSCLSYFRSGYLLEQLGPEKILFGSDYPYSLPELELFKLRLLIPDQQDREQVFSRNAQWLLGAC